MGREVDHADSDALTPSVGLQPVKICFIGTLPDLSEQIGQHCEGACPEVQLKTMQLTRFLQGFTYNRFLVLDIPGEKDEHILDIGRWKIPNAIVTLDFVSVRKVHVYSSDDEGLSSHFSNSRDLG